MHHQVGSGPTLSMLYGTAWKGDRTARLVCQALQAGFRGVDTAAQPKHYQEHLVGQGVRDAISRGYVRRDELYLQTKYTPISGQDPRAGIPYDPKASIADQVHASVASSLRNLRTTTEEATDDGCSSSPSSSSPPTPPYLDCLVLHSPLPTLAQTLEAWRAMSAHTPTSARALGVSNVTLPVLEALCADPQSAAPAVVQNRFHAATGYDGALRAFCAARGIVYQGFWTLTANPGLLRSQLVAELAELVAVDGEVALYALVTSLGNVVVLNGTTTHMRSDLEGMRKVEAWKGREENAALWSRFAAAFERLITSAS